MATEGPVSRTNVLKCLILLVVSDFVASYTYPLFGGRRYLRTVPIRRSAYLPLPVTHHRNEYQLPDYEDGFMTSPQDEYEYNSYDKYPFVQYFGYYPNRDYYHDKTTRRSMDGLGYYNDPQNPIDELPDDLEKDGLYPYGQETWYEEEIPRYDGNAEANAAFLQNLIMAQMYQDAQTQYPLSYDSLADDYDDQHWFYGVPTTEVEEKEKVKQYFKNKEDEEVKELESLAKKKSKNKKLKEKDSYKKQKTLDVMTRPTKPKSKMTEDEYFEMQKQLIVNSRKNNYVPVGEGQRLKKQFQGPFENFWEFNPRLTRYPEPATNSIKKLNLNKDGNAKESKFSESKSIARSSVAPALSTAAPKRPATAGQKEVVLPRPSNPVRRPFPEISTRSLHEPSVYDTIKKLLNMDKDLQKNEIPQPQKRFVLNEDQLTAELSGLKKSSP